MSNDNQNTIKQGKGPGRGRGPMGGGPMGHMPMEKAKNFKAGFGRLMKYLTRHKAALAIVIVMSVLATVFSIFGPKVLGEATTELFKPVTAQSMVKSQIKESVPDDIKAQLENNTITYEQVIAAAKNSPDKEVAAKAMQAEQMLKSVNELKIDFGKVGGIILTVLALYLLSSLFSFVLQFVMAKTSQTIVYDMRDELNKKLAKLPLKYFDGRTHGEILSRVTNDIDTVSTSLQQGLTQVISAVTTLIGIIIMMFTISWLITLVSLVILPMSFFVTKSVIKRSQKYFKKQQAEIGHINGHVEEMYAAHTVVKAFGKEEESEEKFNGINERLYDVAWRAQFLSGIMMPLMNFLSNISYVFVCVIGGVLVINGQISIGDVQAFIQYSRQFTQPIMQVAQIANVMQSTVAAAERVFEVLDEPEMTPDVQLTAVPMARGAVDFEHVSFGYNPDKTVIKDMNLKVNPGDVVAIVGPTGAGKTTLVNLLMRFYEVDEGCIRVDGVDISTMPRETLRQRFGMVLQDTWLFGGTIRDNIAYGRAGATEEEIMKAAKMAHADHFIRTLPDGYDTVLNEEASNISSGQRQLITIARALLADPAVLILDEATSNVDTRTEAYIQNAMIALMKGRTNFVIAHRLSTIRNASTILVMNEGQIIEQGTHKQLMDKNGFYADLYNSQFTGATA